MKINVVQKQIQALPADALIVNLFEGVTIPAGATGAVDSALGATDGIPGDGAVSRLIRLGDFKGRHNEVAVVYTNGMIPAPRVILAGLGRKEHFSLDRVRQASGVAARKARDLGCKRVTSVVHGGGMGGLDVRAAAQATVEGALLGAYQFREYKTNGDSELKEIADFTLVEFNPGRFQAVNQGARDGEIIASGANTARTLINRPPNYLSPGMLADYCIEMAARVRIACTVYTEKEIAENKMGGLQAVSQGSANAPRFVILDSMPGGRGQPLVYVGKGVTFDTGGISLKDPAGMENMKADMGGAAAVIGALQAIGELGLPQRVIGLVPLVENMPGGRAFRPSDVITMMSGTTVEIISTDAEGRLILADALHFAKRYEPGGVVDLATLTGASIVALGEGIAAGLFSNSEKWAERILQSARQCGERMWQMPLFAEYGEKIKSDVADIKNSTGRTAGVGTSAYFLKRFVETEHNKDAYRWAHVDMASMMFSTENKGYQPRGAIGYGVRTLVELARSQE
ncbi:MAG: leucyl aminopeptidase [Chloroflexi bacterium]|nr:leucyl aminopeptidase [Chloroflexota bacterium]MCL5273373.1 leucyl aminopeptidase [Chloroflexota bacterium]